MLLLLIQLLSRLGSLGFEQMIQRQGLAYPLSKYYLYAFLGSMALGVILLPLMGLLKLDMFLVFLVAGVSLLVSILRVNIAVLIHEEMIKKIFVVNLGQALLQFVLYATVFSTRNVGYFLSAWIVTVTCAAMFSYYLVNRVVRGAVSMGEVAQGNPSVTGFRYFGVVFPEMAISFCLELPVIRHVLGAQATGLYSVSNTMSGIYYQVSIALSAIVAKGNLKLNKLLTYTALAVFAVVFAVLSFWLLPMLFGSNYAGALKFLVIILPAVWLMSILRIEQMSSERTPRVGLQVTLAFILILGFFASSALGHDGLIYGIVGSYLLYAIASLVSLKLLSRSQGENKCK